MPYHILNMDKLGLGEKLLYAHIYSYGRKGCWQANETIGQMFRVCERTVTTWVANLKKAGCILWAHPKGRYRTIWARTHPDVKAARKLLYMGQEISKDAVITGQAGRILPGRNLPGPVEENCRVTRQFDCNQPGRNLLHTNNTTKKDTTKKTKAAPAPLPAGGQAPALLAERKKQVLSSIERFKNKFGSSRRAERTDAAQFERRRDEILRALRAGA